MIQALIISIRGIFLAFAYRLRGGGFIQLGDTSYRAIWGACLALAFLSSSPFSLSGPYRAATMCAWFFMVFAGAWLGELIPHGFCMNMGRRSSSWYNLPILKRFPGLLAPEPKQADFASASFARKYIADAIAMGTVGLSRALCVVCPGIAWGLYVGNDSLLLHAGCCIVARAFLQPLAYTIGWLIPFTIGKSLTAKSTEWCEFLDGLFWTFALVLL